MTIAQVIHEPGSRPMKIWTDDVDSGALKQLANTARLPFIHPNGVVAMPDVHLGIGATVGSVIATHGAIIPAAVGVDIGCGMDAVRLSISASDLPDSLAELRHSIERGIPLGTGGRQPESMVSKLCWDMPKVPSTQFLQVLSDDLKIDDMMSVVRQLCTLGSGNHFIELCLDEEQRAWVMLHSGSRGIGNMIGRHFIEKAKLLMETFFVSLPDKDLAFLPVDTIVFEQYIEAVGWAQDFAAANRRAMMREVLRCLAVRFPGAHATDEAISCHHNYVALENHFGCNVYVTRKGAIRARCGDLGIIPGSMGAKSYIVRGKGNAESYCSCSHGAGRKYGRREAERLFTVDDLKEQTQGVECRKDSAVLDEIPSAYKDIDQVMANQDDLVEVVHTLKQVMCIKGG